MQYSKNMGIMTDKDLKVIQNTSVIVIGVGGLGGYIASSLVRLGVSNITIVDFDIFDESNLNRQMFATTKTIGKVKVDVVKQELLDINPNTNVVAINNKLDKDFDLSYFNNIDIAFDAVDNIESKLFLESLCTKFKIPLMHGAIGGFYGQFGIVMPGSNILSEIYKDRKKGLEEKLMSPTFTPAIAANLMIGEFVKLLIEKDALINEILFFNTLDHDYGTMYKK
jgi:molybdopterin/thiamine biosynthesis adenylyltransferase